MSTDLRLVFDTNVLISGALFAQGKPGQALRWALRQGQLLISPSTLAEISEVIGRTKFERYLTASERDEFLAALTARALLVEPAETIRACRDPKDDQFLELAVGGGADYLVTSDADLLILNPFRGVEILTPAQFLVLVPKRSVP